MHALEDQTVFVAPRSEHRQSVKMPAPVLKDDSSTPPPSQSWETLVPQYQETTLTRSAIRLRYAGAFFVTGAVLRNSPVSPLKQRTSGGNPCPLGEPLGRDEHQNFDRLPGEAPRQGFRVFSLQRNEIDLEVRGSRLWPTPSARSSSTPSVGHHLDPRWSLR